MRRLLAPGAGGERRGGDDIAALWKGNAGEVS